jgi:hypothetical protein
MPQRQIRLIPITRRNSHDVHISAAVRISVALGILRKKAQKYNVANRCEFIGSTFGVAAAICFREGSSSGGAIWAPLYPADSFSMREAIHCKLSIGCARKWLIDNLAKIVDPMRALCYLTCMANAPNYGPWSKGQSGNRGGRRPSCRMRVRPGLPNLTGDAIG